MGLNSVGINRPDSGLGNAGTGFVILPEGVDREDYIKECLLSATVSITIGIGSSCFHQVPVALECIQNIVFPEELYKLGSAVGWIRDWVTTLPVIISTFKVDGEFLDITEDQFRITRGSGTREVEVFFDGNTSTLNVDLIGDGENPATVNIKVNSKNADSQINLFSDNQINLFSDNEINLSTNGKFKLSADEKGKEKATILYDPETGVTVASKTAINMAVRDTDDKDVMNLAYSSGNGLSYKDEFDNEIEAVKDTININSKSTVNIKSKIINLGDGSEAMIKGDTLKGIIDEFLQAVMGIIVTTPMGPSIPPLINVAQFTAIKAKLSTILSNVSKTD